MILIFLPYNLEGNKNRREKRKNILIYRWTGIFSKKNKKEKKNIQVSCFSSLLFGNRNLTYP